MSDIATFIPELPEGFTASVERGWPVLFDAFGRGGVEVATVDVGKLRLPQVFSLTVGPSNQPDEWALVLMFMVDLATEQVKLTGVIASGLDADVALDRVRKTRDMTWWMGWTRLRLIVDDVADPTTADGPGVEALRAQLNAAVAPRPKRNGAKVTVGMLREVAEVYEKAQRENRATKTAVAEHFTIGTSTAARWIALAKSSGLLPTR